MAGVPAGVGAPTMSGMAPARTALPEVKAPKAHTAPVVVSIAATIARRHGLVLLPGPPAILRTVATFHYQFEHQIL